MKKILLLLIILCGCSRQRSFACQKYESERQIYLDIESINDHIESIAVKEVLILPIELMAEMDNQIFLEKQLDENTYISGNSLIKEYSFIPEEDLSVIETLKGLKKEYFICE